MGIKFLCKSFVSAVILLYSLASHALGDQDHAAYHPFYYGDWHIKTYQFNIPDERFGLFKITYSYEPSSNVGPLGKADKITFHYKGSDIELEKSYVEQLNFEEPTFYLHRTKELLTAPIDHFGVLFELDAVKADEARKYLKVYFDEKGVAETRVDDDPVM